tara:strand:- start:9886 stop:10602 length:717 start_codon:yes stop_codon:yes gene_type:complete
MTNLNIVNDLKKNLDRIKVDSFNNIFFFIYSIKITRNKQHQYILMEKDNNKYNLIKYNKKNGSIKNSIKKISNKINSIGVKKLNKAKKKIFNTEGYFEKNENIYIFINVKNIVDIYTYNKNDKLIWATKHEILNYKKILNNKIDKNFINFFLNNYRSFSFENEHSFITLYLEIKEDISILEIINSFDTDLKKFYCIHVQKIKNRGKIIRVIIDKVENIIDNKFFFNTSNNLNIISIFE